MDIIDLNVADIFNAIGGGSALSVINSVLHPVYAIRKHGDSEIALNFSGMSAIQSSGSASIVTAPVEEGKFQSINKVRRPNRIVCTVVVSGLTGFTGTVPNIFDLTLVSQSETLKVIKEMMSTAQTYDIETPKETLESYDITDYSYNVNARHGVTLLTINLLFQEVIQQMEVSFSDSQDTKKPTQDSKVNAAIGMGSSEKKGDTNNATVDDLSKSWSSLKSSLGEAFDNVTGGIFSDFQSSLKTVGQKALNVTNSAINKTTELTKNINGSLS